VAFVTKFRQFALAPMAGLRTAMKKSWSYSLAITVRLPIDARQMSVKMSDMRSTPKPKRTQSKLSLPRSFTLRDLNRLRERLREAGFVPPSPSEIERIHRLIAGDE
jgi:hypothetical protein